MSQLIQAIETASLLFADFACHQDRCLTKSIRGLCQGLEASFRTPPSQVGTVRTVYPGSRLAGYDPQDK